MSLKNRLTLLAAGIGLIAVGRRGLQKKLAIQDKVVLITGGSRGLGLAVAEEFASQGAKLVLCARNEQELQKAQEHFSPSTTAVLTVRCDVTDPNQVQQLIEKALNQFGQIDIVVNNARHYFRRASTHTDARRFRRVYECYLLGNIQYFNGRFATYVGAQTGQYCQHHLDRRES